jgi:chromosomal replication initiator protein
MLHAIGNYIFDTYKDKKILYLKTDDLNRKIYSVIKDSDRIEALKDELTNYDVILVDDIQMIQNKGKIGEIAFYAYNKFIDSKKIIIVTSDISPDELKIEKRVISRLTSGLVQHMSTPDVETIKKIINLKIKNENFSFTADAIE